MDHDKRRYRQLKREVKRTGSRKMRRHLQRELTNCPEDAAHSNIDYGRDSSASLNGNDHDTTRRKQPRAEEGAG
jgi:hypothetical protein